MHSDPGLEDRLQDWLGAELDIHEPRRVVRADRSRVLVSKCPPGFASELMDTMDALPELLDKAAIAAAYEAEAAAAPQSWRAECWHRAMFGLLSRLCTEHGLPASHEEEVRIGIESAAALLDTILWSGPRGGDRYTPLDGEVAAYREALGSPSRDLFTRVYGVFEGAQVVNHCPGAPIGRAMLAQAWEICTGAPPPSATGEGLGSLESGA
jgi:hypothetical protein